jgi:thioredoxin 1
MIQVTSKSFVDEVGNFKGAVVADFYADWCNPCKMLSPLMEQMSKDNKDPNVKFIKINVDQEQELAGQYGVMSIPTVIFFKDGKKVSQRVGVSQKSEYEDSIKKTLSHVPATKSAGGKVKVFSTPTCPYCHMAKAYLKDKKIEFEDIDVSQDQNQARAMVEKSGEMGVPQLWINDEVVIGFNKPVIDQLLGL